MKIFEIVFSIVLIVIDQISKYWVSNSLDLFQSVKVIPDFFSITLCHNTGAAWSMFSGLQSLFIVFALAVSAFLIYYLFKHKNMNKLTRISFILMISGSIGNAIDRILHNYVIDFLDFIIPIIKYNFPVFNFADCCLTVGVSILIILVLTGKDGLDGNN